MITYLYFTVVNTCILSPCALFPISSLSWVHVCCISLLSLCSDAIFSLGSFWTPGTNVPRNTRTSFCSHLTNFSFLPHLPFGSFRAPWSNFPWDSYSTLRTPLSDAALLSFEAISTWSTRSSRYSWHAGHSWHSRMRIRLLKQMLA